MLSALGFVFALALGPAKAPPAQVPLRGVAIDRSTQPVHVVAEGKGGARILLDESTAPGLKEAAMTELVMLPGAAIPEHSHDTSAELLYVIEGHAQMTLDGQSSEVHAGMAIFIPAGVKHSMRMTSRVEPFRAIQVYTPGGPEQRFQKGEAVKE